LLDLSGCATLERLPEGLTVGGALDLSGCAALERLPDNLTVIMFILLDRDSAVLRYPEQLKRFALIYERVEISWEKFFHPTVDWIMNELNSEVQRVMLERFGEDRFIEESGLQPVHSDRYGMLYRVEFASRDAPLVKVRVVDPSTGRVYWLGVDPSQYNGDAGRIAQAAVASTWRMDDSPRAPLVFADWRDYAPLVET
jgi:hypothetical protein